MRRLIALVLLGAAALAAQEKNSIQASGEEVLVDVVVRDKNGRAVTNLPESAFTISDEGVPRSITAFRLVHGADAAESSGAAQGKLDPLRQLRLITLVFDRLDQGERILARQSALDLLKNGLPANVYVSVFTLGNELQAIQGFTNQHDLLVKAVERATSGPSAGFARDSDEIRAQLEQRLGPNVSGAQDYLTRYQEMSGDPFMKIMARLTLDMLSLDERSEIAYSGRSTIWALLAAVRGQSQLPGRKAFVYFSEGFSIPQGAEDEFKAVISAANKNSVSFYPLDAHGLSETKLNARAIEGLSNATEASSLSSAIANGSSEIRSPVLEIAQSTDTAITANRLNTQDTLAMLAEETGGFLTANTNDFRAPLQRVLEELNTYYEISYTPRIDNYDGKFHSIDVKVDRPQLKVQSRAGYFALPPEMLKTTGLNTYEVALLRALTNMTPGSKLPFESGGMHFHGDGHFETCGFLIDMPLSGLTLRKNSDGSKYTGGVDYVALIRDVRGAVVKKLQGEMPVELTPDQVLSFKQGRYTDMEYFDVLSGYYTIDVAVLDRERGETGTRRSALFVPKPSDTLSLSSISLIRKWRARDAQETVDDPFVVGDKTVTPTLMPKINKSVSSSLPLLPDCVPGQNERGQTGDVAGILS